MKKQQDVNAAIEKNEAYLKEKLGIDVSYDIDYREVFALKHKIQFYFVSGLCDSSIIQELLKIIIQINDNESEEDLLPEILTNRLIHQQLEELQTMDEVVDQILSGLIVIFLDGYDRAFAIDVRNYPGRQPEEPDTEHVVRGSRDGYTENIIENTALTRRRIRDARLRHEMLKVGERSKTDICLCYIDDVTDRDLIKITKEKLEQIEIDGITMTDKTLEEFISGRKWKAYPLVRYTERPDVAATHLMEGHIVLIVDTSPSVIILPTTFFHHMQHAEEYRQTPLIG